MNIDPRLNEIKDCLYRVATKVLISNDGKLLVVMEKDDDWWNLPGGGIDHGEEIEASLIRELNEEVGLEPSDIFAIGNPLLVCTTAVLDGVPRVNIVYKIDVRLDALKPGKDVSEFKWVTPEAFLALAISPGIAPYAQQIVDLLI